MDVIRVVVLSGYELRHQYFITQIRLAREIEVVMNFCEDQSLSEQKVAHSGILRSHFEARSQSEIDFFSDVVEEVGSFPRLKRIARGSLNDRSVVDTICSLDPDLIVCFGCSLVGDEIISAFPGRIVGVHLGLSPYYRGSGSNIWPIINQEPEYLGATFFYVDAGIDTGEIIHQIRAEIVCGDNCHSVGNRLIKKMTAVFIELIRRFENLERQEQPVVDRSALYLRKDFDDLAVERLYSQSFKALYDRFAEKIRSAPKLVEQKGFS